MYGYQDSEDLGKQGGKFGLNTGAHVTKFEYNPNGGKDGAAADAIDLTVQVGEREYRSRFFPITKVYKDNQELTDPNSQDYKDEFQRNVKVFNIVISDIVKCFVSEEDLKTALATPIPTFKDFAQIVTRLVQTSPSYDKKPVDVFLQYQWQPRGNNDKTYIELPSYGRTYHGQFIVPSQGTGFKEDLSTGSLKYVNEAGAEHPFKRSEWFMTSDFAKQQTLGTSSASANMNARTSQPTGGAGW